ncbi:MAG: hypothetical protein AAF797_05010 [Planctomycetota bacterium]
MAELQTKRDAIRPQAWCPIKHRAASLAESMVVRVQVGFGFGG